MSKPYPSPSYSIVQSSIGWLRRNLLLMAVLAVCVSLAITYSIIDNAPTNFEMKPKRMMTLLFGKCWAFRTYYCDYLYAYFLAVADYQSWFVWL